MAAGRGKAQYQGIYGASASMRSPCFIRSCCWLVLWSCLNALHVSCNDSINFSLQNNEDFSLQNPDESSNYPSFNGPDRWLFLTNDPTEGAPPSISRYNVGRVIYKKPISLQGYHHQFFSFNTTFNFTIRTLTKYNESGDGIAFVMTTDAEIPQNSTGRFLGLMPQSSKDRNQSFLAVEFDTFQNFEPGFNDPSASHIGIDISNLSSVAINNTADESNPLYLYHNYTFTAWVSYSASAELIQVWATNKTSTSSDQPSGDPVLTFRSNLSQVFENYIDVYVGIISASGNNSQASILFSWSFNMTAEDRSSSAGLGRRDIVLLVIGILSLAVLGCTVIILRRQLAKCVHGIFQHMQSEKISNERYGEDFLSNSGVHRYRYAELERATQRFDNSQVIGKGGFSTVYKGVLDNGRRQVAVKKMTVSHGQAESMAREVQIISKTRHRYLMELRGWCYEREGALLVYDYMPRGSLDSHLYGAERSTSGQILDSQTRFNIIVGVAAALEYLHEDLPGQEKVLHRDVKSANVLLTDTMEPRLADFGLSRLVANDDSEMKEYTVGGGTPGYVAPEVWQTGSVDDKVDVYSFGVLALEVACGRRALNPGDSQYSRLVDWVWLRHQKTSILDALDPKLVYSLGDLDSSTSNTHTLEQISKWQCVLHLGLLCCQEDPNARPPMKEVHQVLKEGKVLPAPTGPWTLYPSPPTLRQYQGTPHLDANENGYVSNAAAPSKAILSLSSMNVSCL